MSNKRVDLVVCLDIVGLPGAEVPLRLVVGSPLARAFDLALLEKKTLAIIYQVPSNSLGCIKAQGASGSSFHHLGTLALVGDVEEHPSEEGMLKITTHAINIVRLVKVLRNRSNESWSADVESETWDFSPREPLWGRGHPFPRAIYQGVSPSELARRAWELSLSSERWSCSDAIRDPVKFSFWLANNVCCSRRARLGVLECQTAVERLLHCLGVLESSRQSDFVLACSVCTQGLALRQRMFNVQSAPGTCGVYVNLHGAVHQTVTVSELLPSVRLLLSGVATARDSWFPGFAWTILSCGVCFQHLGWKFTKLLDFPWLAALRRQVPGEDFFYGFRSGVLLEREANMLDRENDGTIVHDEDIDEGGDEGNEDDDNSNDGGMMDEDDDNSNDGGMMDEPEVQGEDVDDDEN